MKKKNVYVVLPEYEYEGNGEPLAAFDDKRKMNAWLRRYEKQEPRFKDGDSRAWYTVELNPVRK